MDDAFDDDDHNNQGETVPLTLHQPRSPVSAGRPPWRSSSQPVSNAYDFERDYDYPPPGSPPSSTLAFPNNFGNSNGQLPTSPVDRSQPQSIFRRTFGALLPQHYQRIREDRPRGGGTDNDGVFANVTAKPVPSVSVVTDDGDVHMVPEETQEEAPPSYVAASADAAPSYWNNTVHAPSALDLTGDVLIDELPTGSVIVFVTTTLVSWFFQLPGFVLTYLLHGSHAGRFGSQAGLALTLIQLGFGTTVMSAFSAPSSADGDDPLAAIDVLGILPASGGGGEDGSQADELPHWGTVGSNSTADGNAPTLPDMRMAVTGHEWISFILLTIGWFLLLTSIIGYFRVKRFEMSVRASRAPSVLTAEDMQRDIALRRNLEEVFGINLVHESEGAAAAGGYVPLQSVNRVQPGRLRRSSLDRRLENDLRATGLI